ncbi:MAG: 50S ribosomal protein L24 [Thermoplasmata archaeon]|nr:50S ribosomal protein L24 [Thermoplasmata archaeon]
MSKQPRKQRKMMHTAPLHRRRKMIASHLAEDLILKYRRRSLPVVKGDTVKVMRGEFRGHTGKVREVDTKRWRVEVEGVIITKVDGKKVPRPVHASNLLITKLNLTDPWRRRKLEEGLPEEVKKEIEKEAEEQVRVMEEEMAAAEEEARKAEEEAEEEMEEAPSESEEVPEEVEEISEETAETAEEEEKEEIAEMEEEKEMPEETAEEETEKKKEEGD